MIDGNRRKLMTWLGVLLATPALARPLVSTPPQTAGPFYPDQPPLDDDADLTRVVGRDGVAQGDITDLSGRILDTDGRPMRGARVELWQCDATGRYHHPRDRGANIDLNFQGFGRTFCDDGGHYRFRTIRPVPYPGRTPHIHMAVFRDGAPPLVTQLYVEGEPRNAGDFIFNRIPSERRHLVVAKFLPAPTGGAQLEANFDIVVAAEGGTPRA